MHETKTNWLGINWQISPVSGWGVLGANLAIQAEQDGRFPPVPLLPMLNIQTVPESSRPILSKIQTRAKTFENLVAQHPNERCHCDFPILHSLGNRLLSSDAAERIVGIQNLAVIFFEDTEIGPEAHAVAQRFKVILAGSSWNKQVLHRNGIRNVETFLQGIDPELFRLSQRPSSFSPFLIFSGGKLEFRKGQDLVAAAFRKFRERHADAMLVTAWHNHWPASMKGIDQGGYVTGMPNIDAERFLDIRGWLEANGIPRQACHDLGLVPNAAMPSIYARMHVGLFPNRCEGGTNLVAMECMASGLPVILSSNTGHLDLIAEDNCYPLLQQGKAKAVGHFLGTEGWGESSVEEIVETLERVYRDYQEAQRKGLVAAKFMESWSWRKRFLELVGHLQG